MEPDLKRFENNYKEKQRMKNVKEYQDKYFKKITKNHNKNKRR